jgi:hypothetical protein
MASRIGSDKVDEFLLEEFKNQSKAIDASEAVGDTRVTQFMTAASALTSALGIANILVPALKNDNGNLSAIMSSIPAESYLIALAGMFALLAYGWVTLARIIHRNRTTDEHKVKLDRIRKYFLEKKPDIIEYMPYNPYGPLKNRKEQWKSPWSLGTGGLVQTVALMNSVIIATVCIIAVLFIASLLATNVRQSSNLQDAYARVLQQEAASSIQFGFSSFNYWIMACIAAAAVGALSSWLIQRRYVISEYDENYKRIIEDWKEGMATGILTNNKGTELEIGLIVISDDPPSREEIAEKAKRMILSISNYKIQDLDEVKITDIYMDKNSILANQGYALRIRKIEKKSSDKEVPVQKYTLKGPSEILGYAQKRSQMEEDYSDASLKALASKLEGLHMPIITTWGAISKNDPVELMKRNGLNVIQQREVERSAIRVTKEHRIYREETDVAELDIDHVTCNIGNNGYQVSYYNIEIEAKGSGDSSDLSILLTSLRGDKGNGERWKMWPYSKLATIKTITNLVGLGQIKPASKKYELKRTDFKLIEGVLGKEKI